MINNRLKFRAVVTVEYGGENADDKSATLVINNVAPQSNGNMCGFDIDELDKALERAGIDDEQDIDQIRQFLYDNSFVPDSDDYFSVDVDNILQSTGKTATDGRLIYDGDIIQDVDLRLYKYEVFWREYGWYVRRTDDHNNITSLYTFEPDNLEIIGSIYEPKVKTNEK
ncbi:MAG: hypothetical protein IJU89_01315 [Alphaproteobacteria bacterium]|nr:hypothetical protein [Alphaproteobacteria bacterium]